MRGDYNWVDPILNWLARKAPIYQELKKAEANQRGVLTRTKQLAEGRRKQIVALEKTANALTRQVEDHDASLRSALNAEFQAKGKLITAEDRLEQLGKSYRALYADRSVTGHPRPQADEQTWGIM